MVIIIFFFFKDVVFVLTTFILNHLTIREILSVVIYLYEKFNFKPLFHSPSLFEYSVDILAFLISLFCITLLGKSLTCIVFVMQSNSLLSPDVLEHATSTLLSRP